MDFNAILQKAAQIPGYRQLAQVADISNEDAPLVGGTRRFFREHDPMPGVPTIGGRGNTPEQNLEAVMRRTSFGGEMGLVRAPMLHAPVPNSLEAITSKTSGWQPGLREQFDLALFHKNAPMIQKMLPNVPADYQARFAENIAKILGR